MATLLNLKFLQISFLILMFAFFQLGIVRAHAAQKNLQSVIDACEIQSFYPKATNKDFENWETWLSKLEVNDSVSFYKALVESQDYSDFSRNNVRMSFS